MNKLHSNCGQIANSGVPSTARVAARGEPENASQADKCGKQKRELFALWCFVAISFVALVFAVYGIWVRCQGNSPTFPSFYP